MADDNMALLELAKKAFRRPGPALLAMPVDYG